MSFAGMLSGDFGTQTVDLGQQSQTKYHGTESPLPPPPKKINDEVERIEGKNVPFFILDFFGGDVV